MISQRRADYYTIKGFSKFIVDFLEKIVGIKREEKYQRNKISIVGYSLGGHISTQFAIENKEMIEKLVLIGPSGLLKEPTQWLREYLNAAMELNPVTRYEKVTRVFEDLYASPSRLLPVSVDFFNYIIEKQGARYAFEAAHHNTTTTQIKTEGFRHIENVPCLIIWGDKDIAMPNKYYERFRQKLPNAKLEEIRDAGHSLIDEKRALVYDKIRISTINAATLSPPASKKIAVSGLALPSRKLLCSCNSGY